MSILPKRVAAEDAMDVFAGVFDVASHRGPCVPGVLGCQCLEHCGMPAYRDLDLLVEHQGVGGDEELSPGRGDELREAGTASCCRHRGVEPGVG